MVTDFFGTLLQELAQALHLPSLQPDANNSCILKFKGEVIVQIEIDRSNQSLVIGSDLGSIPAGRYRENIFTEALKANGMPLPRYGIFAYSKQSDHLVIFDALPIRDLTGTKVADFLPLFVQKARIWKTALERGDIPPLATLYTAGQTSGIFGLKP